MGNPLSLFIVLSILTACGRQVQISTKKLQYNSSLSDGLTKTSDQSGTLKRGKPDTITSEGSAYPVSIYSSHFALEFIAARPLKTEIEVKFRGKTKDSEMVLEFIETK